MYDIFHTGIATHQFPLTHSGFDVNDNFVITRVDHTPSVSEQSHFDGVSGLKIGGLEWGIKQATDEPGAATAFTLGGDVFSICYFIYFEGSPENDASLLTVGDCMFFVT